MKSYTVLNKNQNFSNSGFKNSHCSFGCSNNQFNLTPPTLTTKNICAFFSSTFSSSSFKQNQIYRKVSTIDFQHYRSKSLTPLPQLLLSSLFSWSKPRLPMRLNPFELKTILLFLFVSIHLLQFSLSYALPPTIKIGGIFSPYEQEQSAVFRYAIDRLNKDSSILARTHLQGNVVQIANYDSFHAHKKVCSLLANGTIALFGPLTGRVYHHVESISDALEIPHLECHWNSARLGKQQNQLSVNIYPRNDILSRAYIDLVKAWNWQSFVIVYEANEGLIRVQDFLKEAEKYSWQIRLYQFTNRHYRDIFWEIKQARIYNVIVDVKRENIFLALKHAQQVGMVTEYQNFLITSLDLHTINLENFQYAKTKIISLRLIDFSSSELIDIVDHLQLFPPKRHSDPLTTLSNTILTESALLYDAVKLFANALQDLDQSQSISMPSTSCVDMNPWLYGTSLMNYMRPITFRGITGLVGFDQLGQRSNFQLEVVALTRQGVQKIGHWNGGAEIERLNISDSYSHIFNTVTLENKSLTVTTILNDPYCMYAESSLTKLGNDRFEGFVVDLIFELSQLLGFKYTFKLVDDGAYGTNENGEWNGMIGELINKKADIAVVDLTITLKRAEAVDFTLPFMNTGISILFKKPTTKVTTLFSFMSPFSSEVWMYVLAAYIGVSTILFLVGRMSPYEWENPNPCEQDDEVLENNFSLVNSYFFTIGSLMQQGSGLPLKAMSTRSIAGLWYFFTLIMISSYTANLAAFLTVEKVIYPISSAQELAQQTNIEYGCLGSGSTKAFFKDSNISTFKRMYTFMKARPHVFVAKNDDGKKRVEKGNYAYLMESASIEYIVERNCNLTQIGGLLDSKGYGIATRKNSRYRNLLSQAILKLQETGRLHALKDKWWKQKKGGGQCVEDSKKSSSVTALKLDNVGGVFVVLIGGLSIALLVAICEFLCDSRDSAIDGASQNYDSICEEMVNGVKFSLKCDSKTKPIRPDRSSAVYLRTNGSMRNLSTQSAQFNSSNNNIGPMLGFSGLDSRNNSTATAVAVGGGGIGPGIMGLGSGVVGGASISNLPLSQNPLGQNGQSMFYLPGNQLQFQQQQIPLSPSNTNSANNSIVSALSMQFCQQTQAPSIGGNLNAQSPPSQSSNSGGNGGFVSIPTSQQASLDTTISYRSASNKQFNPY